MIPFCAVVALASLLLGGDSLKTRENLELARQRKLFFLFTADDTLPHADIWDRFFSEAQRGVHYEVLLHCQQEEVCREMSMMWGENFSPEVIPTVPSQYCGNLIDPMLALLRYALQKDPSQAAPESDQFVFVSDSTVPIKDFWNVSSKLRGGKHEPTTRLCVEPWAVGKQAHRGSAFLVKTSQWMTLGRQDSMTVLYKDVNHQKTITVKPLGGTGCSDEFWFFGVLFGLLKPHYGESFQHALGRVRNFNEQCDTYVDWEHHIIDVATGVPTKIPYGAPLKPALAVSPQSKGTALLTQVGRGKFGPAEVREFSPETLRKWKASPWVFLRKVAADVVIKDPTAPSKVEAFSAYILNGL